jgi:6-pyruvoyltetrahydropterin/6-carboxytetrahydropterin synthase
MSIQVTRRFQFCAGHRVFLHESKCRNLHGHNYVAHITVESGDVQDHLGRVVDFSVVKEKMGGWIEQYWDHGFLYYKNDEVVADLFAPGGPMDGHKCFGMPENPTAENMAKFLLLHVGPFVFDGTPIRVMSVRLEETENCSATVDFIALVDRGDRLTEVEPGVNRKPEERL